jgi:hypothetical protein
LGRAELPLAQILSPSPADFMHPRPKKAPKTHRRKSVGLFAALLILPCRAEQRTGNLLSLPLQDLMDAIARAGR